MVACEKTAMMKNVRIRVTAFIVFVADITCNVSVESREEILENERRASLTHSHGMDWFRFVWFYYCSDDNKGGGR